MVTLDQLKKIIPLAGSRAGVFFAPLVSAMGEYGIDTPLRQAAFLAQIAHESGSLRYVAEIASGSAYDDRKDLGNTRPEAIAIAKRYGTTPGRWWKGHGLIQITGYDNHLACGEALGLGLLNNPRLLEAPTNAARSAGWFWSQHGLNKWADAGDFDGVSDVINRGRKTAAVGDAYGYKERLAFYKRAMEVLS
ncbi:MAG TPA: glycoside hydrolase family 19 protein [Azonexus sp.]|nr:glycoside hydrolase family 19 protein [Azonexus sp.]